MEVPVSKRPGGLLQRYPRLRLPALLLLACLCYFGGHNLFVRLTTTPAKWSAIVLAGDKEMAQKHYLYAERHYLRALTLARACWPGSVYEAEASCRMAKAFFQDVLTGFGDNQYRDARANVCLTETEARVDFWIDPRGCARRYVQCQFAIRKLDWAQQYWRRGIAIYEAQPDACYRIPTVYALLNLSELEYVTVGKRELAQTHLARALDLLDAGYRPDDLDSAETLKYLGYYYPYPLNARCLLQALAIARRWATNQQLDEYLGMLQYCYAEQKDCRRAIVYARQRFLLKTATCSPNSITYANDLYELASWYRDFGYPAEAEAAYLRAAHIYATTSPVQYPGQAECYYRVSILYADQGKAQQQEAMLVKAITVAMKSGPQYQWSKITALENYSQFLHSQGRTEAIAIDRRIIELGQQAVNIPGH